MNLNIVEKIRTFKEHLKLKITIFLKTLNLGLKNVVFIKKKSVAPFVEKLCRNKHSWSKMGSATRSQKSADSGSWSKIEKK